LFFNVYLTRMLSGKFFAIASVLLAATVSASPVDVVEKRAPQAVCSSNRLVSLDLPSCGRVVNEVQTLTIPLT
jgi:hypothetical protein